MNHIDITAPFSEAEINHIDITAPFSKAEIKATIQAYVKRGLKERWQKQWEEERTGRWLYCIQRKVHMLRSTGRTRKEETTISRFQFGLTELNGTLFKIGKRNRRNVFFFN